MGVRDGFPFGPDFLVELVCLHGVIESVVCFRECQAVDFVFLCLGSNPCCLDVVVVGSQSMDVVEDDSESVVKFFINGVSVCLVVL